MLEKCFPAGWTRNPPNQESCRLVADLWAALKENGWDVSVDDDNWMHVTFNGPNAAILGPTCRQKVFVDKIPDPKGKRNPYLVDSVKPTQYKTVARIVAALGKKRDEELERQERLADKIGPQIDDLLAMAPAISAFVETVAPWRVEVEFPAPKGVDAAVKDSAFPPGKRQAPHELRARSAWKIRLRGPKFVTLDITGFGPDHDAKKVLAPPQISHATDFPIDKILPILDALGPVVDAANAIQIAAGAPLRRLGL